MQATLGEQVVGMSNGHNSMLRLVLNWLACLLSNNHNNLLDSQDSLLARRLQETRQLVALFLRHASHSDDKHFSQRYQSLSAEVSFYLLSLYVVWLIITAYLSAYRIPLFTHFASDYLGPHAC